MTRTLTLYVNILLALVILVTVVFAFPYAASAFLLYQGAGDLERVLLEQGLDTSLLGDAALDDPKLQEVSLNPQVLARSVRKLEQAIEWDAKNEKAYRNLFNALFLQGNHLAAAEVLVTLVRLKPDDQVTVTSFAELYGASNEDQRQEMLDLWQGIPGVVSALLREGDKAFQDEDVSEALEFYQAALRGDPRSARAYYRTGKVYLNQEMPDRALEAYERAIDLGTFGQGFSQELVDTYNRAGNILLFQHRDWEGAALRFERALAIDPEYAPSLIGLGTVRFHQDELAEARRFLERALSLKSDSAWTYYWLGRLDYKEGLFLEAVEKLQDAVQLNPSQPSFVFWLGEVYRQTQQLDEAVLYYHRALELDPEDSLAEQRLRELGP